MFDITDQALHATKCHHLCVDKQAAGYFDTVGKAELDMPCRGPPCCPEENRVETREGGGK